MKEEILTAKEWLKKETFKDGIMTSKNKEKLMLSDLVEKYANSKNRILEDRIKEFRKTIENNEGLRQRLIKFLSIELEEIDNQIKQIQ